MTVLTRREFVGAGLAAASFWISGTKTSGRVLGANDRVRVAIAGLNGRGGAHISAFLALPGVEIAYLIDPDTRTFAKHLGRIEKQQGRARFVFRMSARLSKTKTSTCSASPRRTTGIR
jgi:hypothetical protein